MGQHLASLRLSGKATYAGRLDPLAQGVCVILTGDDVNQKDTYLDLPKEYLVEVVFGVQTDTLDPLGLITQVDREAPAIKAENITAHVPAFVPSYLQSPPQYSSIPVDGQPAFQHARSGSTSAPEAREASIRSIDLLDLKEVPKAHLIAEAVDRVQSITGDFRQDETIQSWHTAADQLPDHLTVCTLRVSCGSGVYMRSLARDLGIELNTPALARRITRTRVGDFTLPFGE